MFSAGQADKGEIHPTNTRSDAFLLNIALQGIELGNCTGLQLCGCFSNNGDILWNENRSELIYPNPCEFCLPMYHVIQINRVIVII